MNRRLALAALIALVLAAVSAWYSRSTRQQPSRAAGQQHVADYRMHNFTATYMSAEGRPKQRLQAMDMVHFADDDTAELSRPRITIYRPGSPPWRVFAARGHVGPGGKLVTLDKGVRAHRNDPAQGWVEMLTRDMRLRPDDHYAETDSPVTIVQPETVVRAVGMQAYMKTERLILLSEVHGRYDPPPR
jgi:lipopolysaccharide export system protein LptC